MLLHVLGETFDLARIRSVEHRDLPRRTPIVPTTYVLHGALLAAGNGSAIHLGGAMTDFRYEPVPSGKMNESLAARIHDPLWFLSRQWQLGEFQGDDAGSPARLDVLGTTAPIGAYALGGGRWQRYDASEAPLEPLVEATGDGPDVRLRVEAGAHFVRLLGRRNLEQVSRARSSPRADSPRRRASRRRRPARDAGVEPFPTPTDLAPELAALVEGRAGRVAIDAADRRRSPRSPGNGSIGTTRERGAALAGIGDAWDPHRFEHVVRVASSAAGGVVLRAGDYAGDTLGWSEFDVDPASPMPSFRLPPPKPVTLATTPTPVRFGGMPSPRYWEFEDARFNFGNVDAAGHDLGRLLLLQFAALFGNDWFLVPMTLDAGTLTLLDHVSSPTSSAGTSRSAARAARSGTSSRTRRRAPPKPRAGRPLNRTPLPARCSCRRRSVPTLESELAGARAPAPRRDGEPRVGRRAVLRIAARRRVDRHADLARRPDDRQPRADPSGLPQYIVASEVPGYWIPLAPQQLADRRSIRLVVTPLAVPSGDTFKAAKPEGRLLEERLWIYEEEVPRAGAPSTGSGSTDAGTTAARACGRRGEADGPR